MATQALTQKEAKRREGWSTDGGVVASSLITYCRTVESEDKIASAKK